VQEALRRGIRIPESLQILAYDGTFVTDAAGMKITSILQDFSGIANKLSEAMLETINADVQVAESDGAGADQEHNVQPALPSEQADVLSGMRTDEADEEIGVAGMLTHTIPMKVKIGQTTRWNETVRELLFGSHPQTD
jgi:LacI family sucrose operon transcriptional repressor